MDTRELYNAASFSDVEVKRANGTTIRAHKIVLCRNNEYFNSMCGPDSRFVERDQKSIELKEDDPAALEGLLRSIYGLPAIEAANETWRFWLALSITADKYLAPALSEHAFRRFWHHAELVQTAEQALEIVEKISNDASDNDAFISASDSLHDAWLHRLLHAPAFADKLSKEPELMLQLLKRHVGETATDAEGRKFPAPSSTSQFDQAAVAEAEGKEREKWLYLCEEHKSVVLGEAPRNPMRDLHTCTVCDHTDQSEEYLAQIVPPQYQGVPVILPADSEESV